MTPPAESKQNEIWMLFENGEAARVELTIHKPHSESVDPAEAFVLAGRSTLTRSARRAAAIAYSWLNSSGREQEPFVAGFDLVGLSKGPVSGESGGLAFALALVAALNKTQMPAIAATGDISSGHGEGAIMAINGLEEKLKSAAQLLHKGSMIFYPLVNDDEIPPALREEFAQKEITLHGIATVGEALDILFPEITLPSLKKRTKPFRVVMLSFAALCLSIVLFCWIFQHFTVEKEILFPETPPVITQKQEETLTTEPVAVILPIEQPPATEVEQATNITVPDSPPPNNHGFE